MNVSFDRIEAIIVGASAGGMVLIKQMIRVLPKDCLPVIVVQHMADLHELSWIEHLKDQGAVNVKEADEKEHILPGTVYLAPGNYHLLVEQDRTFSLTIDQREIFARPSINVSFETAAACYGEKLLGIILSGGNSDGAEGARCIKEAGGLLIVQDPLTAEAPAMPQAALLSAQPDLVAPPAKIMDLLSSLHHRTFKIS